MLVKQLIKETAKELTHLYDTREAENIISILAEHVFGIGRIGIAMNQEVSVDNSFTSAVNELKKGKPVQYVTCKSWFLGYEIEVNEHTLIPRPETEELSQILIDDHNETSGLKVLDICTGSGCIPVGLQDLHKPEITAIDISDEALVVAKKNSLRHNLEVDFQKVNILTDDILGSYDVIISNPPYVLESEKKVMNNNVLDYEPGLALFVDDEDPLVFYKAIKNVAGSCLKPGGKLYLEINEQKGRAMVSLFEGFKPVLKKDLFGKERFLIASVPG